MSKKPNHYTDVAVFYDYDATAQMNLDLPFYLEYAKKIGAESVLDLCCGTGRVAIKFAEEGYNVTALDLSSAMLDVFREKLNHLDHKVKKNIHIVQGNATDFSLDKKFDLIVIPYRSFQQFAHRSDAEKCLECVKNHLTEKGRFILTCYRPLRTMDEKWLYPKKMQWQVYNEKTGENITKYHWGEKIDTEHQLIYPVLCYEVTSSYGTKEYYYEDLTLKYYYYEQLIEMLQAHGYEVQEQFGDYKKAPIEDGTEYVFVCKA